MRVSLRRRKSTGDAVSEHARLGRRVGDVRPPYGILDPGWKLIHAGSTSLAAAVSERNVRHHVFGHLHGAGGQMVQQDHTIFYNVAACDEEYRLMNQPRVFEVRSSSEPHQEKKL
jgi:hypothetical protein